MKTLTVTLLLCLVLAKTAQAASSPAQSKKQPSVAPRDHVILIHGLGRSPLSLIWLQWSLERAGYRVTNLRYPSHNPAALQISSQRIDRALNSPGASEGGKVHFVTHSLGGIIVRNYLATHSLTNLGRVVMLAPPNHGSELADALRKNWIGRLIIGPVGCLLGTSPSDLPAKLGPPHFPLGVIASDGPGIPWNCLVHKGPSDGIVSVESAKLQGMADFLVVHGSHTLMMCRGDVRRETLNFLKTGSFARTKPNTHFD